MSPVLTVRLTGDGAWPDLLDKTVHHLGNDAPPIQVSALADGMASGAPSVAIRIDLPNGEVVLAETSLALFLMAADALRVRYGDPRR